MMTVAPISAFLLLGAACTTVSGDYDCSTTMMACARNFESSQHDEKCMALFEMEMCVHSMHDNPNCHTYEARGGHRLQNIVDRYSYCMHEPSYGASYGRNIASPLRQPSSVLVLSFLCVILGWTT